MSALSVSLSIPAHYNMLLFTHRSMKERPTGDYAQVLVRDAVVQHTEQADGFSAQYI